MRAAPAARSVVSATAFFFLSIPCAFAQAIELVAPSRSITVPEGDEFSTDSLANPWDLDQRRDIGWEEGFSPESVSANGVWRAETALQGAYLFPLFPGFKGGLFPEPLPGDVDAPKLGVNHPIDASKYHLLSFRMRHDARSSIAVYWSNDRRAREYWPSPDGPYGARFDGFYLHGQGYPYRGWQLYTIDLRSLPSFFDEHRGPWADRPFALRLDPSLLAPPGAVVELDWIRLSDADSTETLEITWRSDAADRALVFVVNADSDGDGYDGTPIAHLPTGRGGGRHELPLAALPPGEWYFYVTLEPVQEAGAGTILEASEYSAPIRIDAKPSVAVTAPSRTSGESYAQAATGDAWDMSDARDVANIDPAVWPPEWRQFTEPAFTPHPAAERGSIFTAVADPPWSLLGNRESDVQVHLPVSQARPIDPRRYRYLTYRMWVDGTSFPSIADKVSRGWVARPVFWNFHILDDAGRAKAHVVYEGWNTYTIDLHDPASIEVGRPWSQFRRIEHLRIDPLETDRPTRFAIDWVELTAENVSRGSVPIEFTIEDDTSRAMSAEVFWDRDNRGFDGSRIGALSGLGNGAHRFHWDTSALAKGSKAYPYVRISDGRSTSSRYASAPVRIGAMPNSNLAERAPELDYDGDGRSDAVVFRPFPGFWIERRRNHAAHAYVWGNPFFVPALGDFDGDGSSDRTLVSSLGGFLQWYSVRSSDGLLYSPAWGLAGDVLAVGDYNGNGRDEAAVFRAGTWFILDEDGAPAAIPFGSPGMIPVPADYDKDGADDLAVWNPLDGVWWIRYSSRIHLGAEGIGAIQWGLPGDIPVAGDWNGDGRAEPCVYRPALGQWFISGEPTGFQWGLFGDIPIAADFNGDTTLDAAVFRPAEGNWYINLRTGQTQIIQFGLPGDLVPLKVRVVG